VFVAGESWFRGFMSRNPSMRWRTSQELGYDRVQVTKEHIVSWFGDLQAFLLEEVPDWSSLLSSSSRVFNCDESGFPLQARKKKVLAPSGARNVYQVTTPGKEQVTVLAAVSAAGLYVPPFIIFKGKRLRNTGLADFDTAVFSVSDKGWMMKDNFTAWLTQFDATVTASDIQRPVILFMDGHSSHFSLKGIQFAREKGIILYCLPAHASHIMQPLDVGIFSSLKASWKSALLRWQWENPGINFTKSDFPGLFKTVWEKSCTKEKAASSFLRAGLFPLDPSAIDMTRLVSSLDTPPASQQDEKAALPVPEMVSDLSYHPELSSSQPFPQTSTPITSLCVAPDAYPEAHSDASSDAFPDAYPSCSQVNLFDSPEEELAFMNVGMPSNLHFTSSELPSPDLSHTYPECCVTIFDMPKETKEVAVVKRLPSSHVSLAFQKLDLPKPNPRKLSAVRAMPKAATGKKALEILQENEENKRLLEVQKVKRKVERQEKKKEKEEMQRLKKKQKVATKIVKNGKTKMCKVVETESESEKELPNLDESLEDDIPYSEMNKEVCPVCNDTEGEEKDWVGCDLCVRWTHIKCTRDEVLMELEDEDDIQAYPFSCIYCDF